MKYSKNMGFYACIACLTAFLIISCSEIDDYKQYTEGGEISYTGKIDSLKVLSGRNRVKLQGLVIADPKVEEARIYWNGGRDSVVVPIERTSGVDTISVILDNLQENIYNFEVRTFDSEGNKSIPVYAMGEVFGERYQQSLNNRPVISNELLGSSLTINYASMDRTSGVIGTEVDFVNTSGIDETLFVPIDSTQVTIENFEAGSEYEYRTLFLPQPTSIDTFQTNSVSFTPELSISNPPYFKNATAPFEIGDNSGNRWHTPAHWIHNEAALSHNGYGTLDPWFGNVIALESGWGAPNIVNGKVYQTFVLEPGTYIYSVDVAGGNYDGISDQAYMTVAAGNTLPDVASVETSSSTIAYERLVNDGTSQRQLIFTLTEITQVSLGVQTTNQEGVDRFIRFNSFSLNEVSQPPYLENSSVPFEAAERDGRWGNLAGWTTNSAAKNHNGYGGWDEWNGNIFNLESGWGAPPITNGKVYQTLILAPGSYTFKANFRIVDGNINTNHLESDEGAAYIVAARGATLPDVSNIETSANTLGFEQIIAGKDPDAFEISFTIEDYTQVSVGFATTQADGTPGRFANIVSFSLTEN